MADRRAKLALLDEVALVGRMLGHAARLELLDVLAQGPRSVESLANAVGLRTTTCSAHLQKLREAGLVTTRREATTIWYDLAGDDVAVLLVALRTAAERHRPGVVAARDRYVGDAGGTGEGVGDEAELSEVIPADDAGFVLLDVRPPSEYRSAHLPGAVNIPLADLVDRLEELPPDREVLAYCRGASCALAHEAVRLLRARGRRARRLREGVLEWRASGFMRGPSSSPPRPLTAAQHSGAIETTPGTAPGEERTS